MTRRAIVVPAPLDQPVRLVEWEKDFQLLGILQRETGYEWIDGSPQIHTPSGTVCMWVGDDSLLQDSVDHNDRAIGLCRACGYNVPDVGGTAVFTGGADEDGETLSIPAELISLISMAVDPHFMNTHDMLTAAGIAVEVVEATATHPEGT